MSTVMRATPHGVDLQRKADQRDVPPDGRSGRTFFSGARRAGSSSGPDADVIALRQYAHHDPNDTDKHTAEHHQAPRNEHRLHQPPALAGGFVVLPGGDTVPTFETLPRFTADLQHLTPAQRRRFRRVVLDAFVPDLRTGCRFRPGLREARGFPKSRSRSTPNRDATSLSSAVVVRVQTSRLGPDRYPYSSGPCSGLLCQLVRPFTSKRWKRASRNSWSRSLARSASLSSSWPNRKTS